MAALNLKSLVGHLNDPTRRALEAAAGLCLSQTNYNVEIEHWLIKLVESAGGDLEHVLRRFEIEPARLISDLTAAMDRFKTGNSRPPALSQGVVDLSKEAWLAASLEFDAPEVRSGHVFYALVSNDMLARQAQGISDEFAKVSAEALRAEFPAIATNSDEERLAVQPGGGAEGSDSIARGPKGTGKTPNLDQYTIDLTERARSGQIDPVLGRDPEIRQIIDILTRRRQNNPILTGEAGVGKTAVAEGFALRLVSGDVPPALQNVILRTLDLALLQAGAGMKGEFENRLKGVIDEVKASPTPIILFIDEAHTLIGAGGAAGQGDAANLLKPALARGELRTIAATTWAEYKKYFERDAALARRFQVVKVEEPDEKIGIEIMRGIASMMENHHNVRILDEALVASVRLSSRYITGRQLPDKSVSLLDTACARVSLSQSATPPAVEDCRRRISQIEVSLRIAEREQATGGDEAERIAELNEERDQVREKLTALEARWEEELALVDQMREIRGRLEADHLRSRAPAPEETEDQPPPLTDGEKADLRAKLTELNHHLEEIQGEEPLVNACVDGQAIAEVVGAWTGIPVGRMVADEMTTILHLRETMEQQIIGQAHALEALAQSIRTSRAGLTDPKRPIGVFMLVGTSGTGKTETAKVLSELFYGGEQNMTVINMSEFKEEHKVSLLLGSPPGYVGYGEGGVLTEAVRRKPYSVVLLDELEKAHPGVQDIFYRLFDEGILTDGEGREIDFRNTVILMTTNVGTDTIMSLCADPETMPDAAGLTEALRPELLKTFKPAFLGRLTILPYFPLQDEVMKKIIELKLGKIGRRVRETYDATFDYDPEVVDAIAERCTEVESGARNVDHILTRTVLPEMAAEFLSRMAEGNNISRVRVSVNDRGAFEYHAASGA